LACGSANAASRHLILCGSGGEEPYISQFREWGERLRAALVDRLGHAAENVHLLVEPIEGDGEDAPGATSLEAIRELFARVAADVEFDDDVFVYLIGHGSYLGRVSRFNIPGPDLDAAEFNALLGAVPVRRAVVINSTSRSAGFVNELSGPGRIVLAATRTVNQRNATRFMEFFILGLEEGSADTNRDERISVLEVCELAATMTETWYLGEGLLATEASILDDNGDGRGTRLPILAAETERAERGSRGGRGGGNSGPPAVLDGDLAALCYIKDFSFPDSVPQELVERYTRALDAIGELKLRKFQMTTDDYYAALEELLVEAARANRDIRAKMPQPTPPPGV
jgi:hypothetical protein